MSILGLIFISNCILPFILLWRDFLLTGAGLLDWCFSGNLSVSTSFLYVDVDLVVPLGGERNWAFVMDKPIIKRMGGYLPDFIRPAVKQVYWVMVRYYQCIRYIEKARYVELGYRFRFTRNQPYGAKIGEKTITAEFNDWNAQLGDIVVGKSCWFGRYNIIMGPVEIGDHVATGPNTMILGPSHPVFGKQYEEIRKTVIGNNVWISAGAIILSGVNIGNDVIIAAGSVVNRDVPDGAFVGGNPIRNLSAMASKTWNKD